MTLSLETSSKYHCPEIVNATTFMDLIDQRVQLQGQETALAFIGPASTDNRSISYADLKQQAMNIAAQLQQQDITGNVLLLYPPSLEFIEGFFGCVYAGVTAVPVFPPLGRKGRDKVHTILVNSGATAVMTSSAISPMIKAWLQEIGLDQQIACIVSDQVGAPVELWKRPDLKSDDVAFLQYTSGSTGDPKGVMVTHGNLLHNMEVIQDAFKTRHGNLLVCGWLPMYHDMGLIGNVFQPLYIGRPCVLMSPLTFLQNPFAWLKAISDYQATTSGAPNFAYEHCVRKITEEQKKQLDLSSWKVAFNGAEPIRYSTLAKFAEAFKSCGFDINSFSPCYGLAEGTLMVTGVTKFEELTCISVDAAELANARVVVVDDTFAGKRQELVSSGVVTDHQDVRIVDGHSLQTLGEGVVGEIWVMGGSVAKGYWQAEEATREDFHAYTQGVGPFLRTGDLGFTLAGNLYVVGRKKDVIILNGANHYPQDLELSAETAIAELRNGCSAAFSLDDGRTEKVVLAAEVDNKELNDEQVDVIYNQLLSTLSREHSIRLSGLILLRKGSMPKTSSGKIQRRRCKQMWLDDALEIINWRLDDGLAGFLNRSQTGDKKEHE